MTDETFADYLRATYQRLTDVDVTVTENLLSALGSLRYRLRELSTDPAIDPQQRLSTQVGPTTFREIQGASNRLYHQFREFLEEGTPIDFKTFVPELKQQAVLANDGMELITEKHPSRKAEHAYQATSALFAAADGLIFAQQAYAAGFQKAADIAKSVGKSAAFSR